MKRGENEKKKENYNFDCVSNYILYKKNKQLKT